MSGLGIYVVQSFTLLRAGFLRYFRKCSTVMKKYNQTYEGNVGSGYLEGFSPKMSAILFHFILYCCKIAIL